jgi:4-nitrophenyl phosphatase
VNLLTSTQIEILRSLRALIIDIDGVLVWGRQPAPGLVPFFEFLRERKVRFLLATNNAMRTPEQAAEHLQKLGVPVEPGDILTAAQATALHLRHLAGPGTPVYVIGETGLLTAMREAGFTLAEEGAEWVVVGLDRAVTYDKLCRATLLIRSGASFVGTNPDRALPTDEGLIPGCGALLAAIQAASGVAPTIIGKPEPAMYHIALERMGTLPKETGAVGDRLDTDILGGRRASLVTILVLSGATTLADLETSDVQPDLVFENIGYLMQVWREVLIDS